MAFAAVFLAVLTVGATPAGPAPPDSVGQTVAAPEPPVPRASQASPDPQASPNPRTSPTPEAAAEQPDPPLLKQEELEQLVAPIALYPDALLAQIFMASTYPLEIVYAARWSKEHPEVKGDAVAKELEKRDWDAAVKSLVAFPDVLAMMNEKLDWTQKLGDAFLAQRKEVMDAVQRLRARAKDAGHLESSKEQTVRTEPAASGSATPQVIVIESSSPQVVYVPTYNPTVVYGAWPYPAYPPYYYYPPGYAAGAAFFSFSVGVFVGSAMWGGCNWGHSDVDIDVNRYNQFNRNVSRNVGDRGWRHDSAHRRGVGYRDTASQQRYGNWGSEQGIHSREEFRGRADAGRDTMSREGMSRDVSSARGGFDPSGRDFGGPSTARSSGAFEGVGNAAGTRMSSSRGAASRGGFSRGGGGGRRR